MMRALAMRYGLLSAEIPEDCQAFSRCEIVIDLDRKRIYESRRIKITYI